MPKELCLSCHFELPENKYFLGDLNNSYNKLILNNADCRFIWVNSKKENILLFIKMFSYLLNYPRIYDLY